MCDFVESYEPDDIRLKLEDNPVTTIFLLRGNPEALAIADEIIERMKKYGVGPKSGMYEWLPDKVLSEDISNGRIYTIVIDNHVPQIYEELIAIEGLETPLFACFSSFDGEYYLTNDVNGVLAKYRNHPNVTIPAELVAEVDEDYFPDLYDLASTEYR